MRFFLDANIPYSALKVFDGLNLKALHAKDIGLSSATDREIIEYAAKNKMVLITKDLEFANLAVYPMKSHCGLIVLRLPFLFKAAQISTTMKSFLNSIDIKDLEKAIVIVKLGKYRLRKID